MKLQFDFLENQVVVSVMFSAILLCLKSNFVGDTVNLSMCSLSISCPEKLPLLPGRTFLARCLYRLEVGQLYYSLWPWLGWLVVSLEG